MNFDGKSGRNVHGSDLKRGQAVRVRVGDEYLGIGLVDEQSADGANAVWISFSGTAPRRLSINNGSIEFTVLESEPRFAYVHLDCPGLSGVPSQESRHRSEQVAAALHPAAGPSIR